MIKSKITQVNLESNICYFGFFAFLLISLNDDENKYHIFTFRMDEMKAGTLVGADKYGNKYYEDPSQFYGRNRWVEFAEHKNLEYDGSQIPAEWFGWMHYKVNLI